MAIDCTGCKAYCCKAMCNIYPNLDNGKGYCKHITEDFKCSIYNERPEICNTDTMKQYLYPKLTQAEYDKKNTDACKQLKEIYN